MAKQTQYSLVGESVSENIKTTNIKTEPEPDVFDSGLKVLKRMNLKIPVWLLQMCKSIRERVNRKEFSILIRGSWVDGDFKLSEDFVVPKQKVGYASVDYEEDLAEYREHGYNVVLHAHPDGVKNFSGADDEHINSHFPISLLYESGDVKVGVALLDVTDGVKLSVPINCEHDYGTYPTNVDISNIKEDSWGSDINKNDWKEVADKAATNIGEIKVGTVIKRSIPIADLVAQENQEAKSYSFKY